MITNKKFYILSLNCCLELTEVQWNKLDKLSFLDIVAPTLNPLGASKIEYNPHYGRNIFFTCDDELAAKAIISAIYRLVG